jgi:hypothetical protein
MQIQKISDHSRTRNGKAYANSTTNTGRATRLGWSMFTVVVGQGSKKRSFTVHGTREQAEAKASQYK